MRLSPAPGASDLAPPPAWTAPRVSQDHGRGLSWTLLDLGLPFGATHLGFDLPEASVGPDVDVATSKTDVTIPPVMLNSHASTLGQISTRLRGATL